MILTPQIMFDSQTVVNLLLGEAKLLWTEDPGLNRVTIAVKRGETMRCGRIKLDLLTEDALHTAVAVLCGAMSASHPGQPRVMYLEI